MKENWTEHILSSRLELSVGTLIDGRYEIVRELGRGGMGIVFQATDKTMSRPVAVKVLSMIKASDEKSRARFVREAQSVSSLTHANIVRIHSYERREHFDYLVMDYIDGIGLDQHLNKLGKVDLKNAIAIISQAAAALHHAHLQGIVHRDIKPSNIMLVDNGGQQTALLLDFGIAKRTEDNTTQKLTDTYDILGTPYYMSPEQCLSLPVDCRTDIYSLGCVFHELLCGEKPFAGESPYAIAYAHLNGSLPLLPNVPHWVNGVIKKATNKERPERFQTMAEFINAIDDKSTSSKFTLPVQTHRLAQKTIAASIALGTLATAITGLVWLYGNRSTVFAIKSPTGEPHSKSLLSQSMDSELSGLNALIKAEDDSKINEFMPALGRYHEAFMKALAYTKDDTTHNTILQNLRRSEDWTLSRLQQTPMQMDKNDSALINRYKMELELTTNTIFWAQWQGVATLNPQKIAGCEQQVLGWMKDCNKPLNEFLKARIVICNYLSQAYNHEAMSRLTSSDIFSLVDIDKGRQLVQAYIEAIIAVVLLHQQAALSSPAQAAALQADAAYAFHRAETLTKNLPRDPKGLDNTIGQRYKILLACTYRDMGNYLSLTKQCSQSTDCYNMAESLFSDTKSPK